MTKASRPWAPQSIRRCLASLLLAMNGEAQSLRQTRLHFGEVFLKTVQLRNFHRIKAVGCASRRFDWWGVPVVAVNGSAFSGCNESKSGSLSRFLEKVGREAFAGCGANADAGFVLTVPSGANLSEGSFSNTNVEIVFW